MPVTKEFKTIDEQILGLGGRHLKFKNKEKAAQTLKKYNYFDVINGFESLLLKTSKPTKEYEDVYFEDFADLFFFDMKLKEYTLFKIFDIESRLRTSIAYNFAGTYCTTSADTMNYTNPVYYKAPDPIDTHLTNIFTNFDLFRPTLYYANGSVKKKSFIDELKKDKDYVKQYQNPPFWVTIKALPLGSLYYTFVFLDDTVKEKVLKDFGFTLKDTSAFEQALFILKEMRNQCAHLELITRFKLKGKRGLSFNDVISKAGCPTHSGTIFYIDVMKIFKLFGEISDIKRIIFKFYLKMCLKGRKRIADKAISKMGRKNIKIWMQL